MICVKCKKGKPAPNRNRCRPCLDRAKGVMERYRKNHRVEIRARRNAARAADPDKARRDEAAWRAANRERDRMAKRAWASANKEKVAKCRVKHRALERERFMRRAYGIDGKTYDAMLAAQGGACAACRDAPGKTHLAVDHDHETGAVRGLLCGQCNLALGSLRDSPARIAALLAYAEKHKQLRLVNACTTPAVG